MSKSRLTLLILLVVLVITGLYFTSFRNSSNESGLIGYSYSDHLVFPDLEEWGQGFDSNIDDTYRLLFVRISGKKALLFTKAVGLDDSGVTKRTVLDVLYFPVSIESLNTLFCGPGVRSGNYDPEIVADNNYDWTKDYFPVSLAWRANRQTERFENISPEGVWCVNESGAYYSG